MAEVRRIPQLLDELDLAVVEVGRAADVLGPLRRDFDGRLALARDVRADHVGIEARAEVVDVAHEQPLAARAEELLEATRAAECRREVAVAWAIRRDAAIRSAEQLAVLLHAHRHELREVMHLVGVEAEVAVLREVRLGRFVGGVAVHQVHVHLAAVELLHAEHVSHDEGQERLAAAKHIDDALHDAAKASRHAAVEHDHADLALLERCCSERVEFGARLRARSGQLLDRLRRRRKQFAGHEVALLRESAFGDIRLPTRQQRAVEAIAEERSKQTVGSVSHGAER